MFRVPGSFAATLRDGHETDNKAVAGTPEDKQDWNSHDYFVRYTHDTQSGNLFRLAVLDEPAVVY